MSLSEAQGTPDLAVNAGDLQPGCATRLRKTEAGERRRMAKTRGPSTDRTCGVRVRVGDIPGLGLEEAQSLLKGSTKNQHNSTSFKMKTEKKDPSDLSLDSCSLAGDMPTRTC